MSKKPNLHSDADIMDWLNDDDETPIWSPSPKKKEEKAADLSVPSGVNRATLVQGYSGSAKPPTAQESAATSTHSMPQNERSVEKEEETKSKVENKALEPAFDPSKIHVDEEVLKQILAATQANARKAQELSAPEPKSILKKTGSGPHADLQHPRSKLQIVEEEGSDESGEDTAEAMPAKHAHFGNTESALQGFLVEMLTLELQESENRRILTEELATAVGELSRFHSRAFAATIKDDQQHQIYLNNRTVIRTDLIKELSESNANLREQMRQIFQMMGQMRGGVPQQQQGKQQQGNSSGKPKQLKQAEVEARRKEIEAKVAAALKK